LAIIFKQKSIKMGLKLENLIYKQGTKDFTTGAKVGAAAIAAGTALLLTRKKKNQSGGGVDLAGLLPQQQQGTAQTETSPESESSSGGKKSNTALYIGLGVGAVVVIGTVIYFVSKKK
jgi:hypothetical protein